MVATYRIKVIGCDDSTEIVRQLTERQRDLLAQIAKEITDQSGYSCQPVMRVEEVTG